MEDQREFEGKDLSEALKQASNALGIAEPELDYEIVEQGRRGLWGIGAKSVRIRVMPPIEPVSAVDVTPDLRVESERKPERPERSPRRARSGRSKSRSRDKREGREKREARDKRESRDKREPRERSKRRESRKSSPPKAEAPVEVETVPLTPEGENVIETVRKMLALSGLELEANGQGVTGGVSIDLSGADQKLLLQRDAELLSALQFLLNRMGRRAWPDTGRIQLSTDGQGARRDDDVVEMVREIAKQVTRTGKPKRLHPMNAYERRLVHLTIRGMNGVASRSEGNGHLKRVRIFRQPPSRQVE